MQLVAIIVLYIMTIDNILTYITHTHNNPIIISLTCAVESFVPYIEH